MNNNKTIKIDMSLLTIGDLYPLMSEPEKSLTHSITICHKLVEGGILHLHPSFLSEILVQFQVELSLLMEEVVASSSTSFIASFQLSQKKWDKDNEVGGIDDQV